MTEWRNELLKDMINAMYKVENMECSKLLVMARAALAVAEPVIREQEDNALLEENARLREAVKNAYYEGWEDGAFSDYSRQEIYKDWKTSEACAAIREGGKDEN